MLSSDELLLLEAIRETGSLSRAAARLGKAPSTVSHAARQLEDRYDALLFDRRRYRLQLTPAGQLLAQEAARLMLDVLRLNERVRQVASGWEHRLWVISDEILEFELFAAVIADFDALQSGVSLRFTQEALGGTWEALYDGRADLVIGATNEPPPIPHLQWFELGVIDWAFAVAPTHPLARQREPLQREQVAAHRSIVVADSSRGNDPRSYGVLGGQPVLAVPGMRAKIFAQMSGLGVGWLPRGRVQSLLARGALIEKAMADPREPNTLYVGWRSRNGGRALNWWLDQLRQPALAGHLLNGVDAYAHPPR